MLLWNIYTKIHLLSRLSKISCHQFLLWLLCITLTTQLFLVQSFLDTSGFRPTSRAVFDVPTLYLISKQCENLSDPILFRAIFLASFYAFLRMSNVAPHSLKQFDSWKHFLRQGVIFAPPGAHLILKWSKTMQDNKSHHIVQIPEIDNIWLCTVRALKALLSSRPISTLDPLFTNKESPFSQTIDTHIRDALKTVLASLRISPTSHGFHTFRRSGGTLTYDNNFSLQNIMAHALWRSQAVWACFKMQHKLLPSSLPPWLMLALHAFDWAW